MGSRIIRYEMPEKNFWAISDKTWNVFIENLKSGGKRFRQSRVTKETLRNLYSSGRSSILYDGEKEEVVAHAALWPTRVGNWNEIGTVWVHESFSGRGFARLIIAPFSERVGEKGENVFMISDKPALLHIVQTLGWQKADKEMERLILCVISPEEDGSPRVKKPESEIWLQTP